MQKISIGLFLVDGVCDGVDSGPVYIALHAGRCPGYSADGRCWFGWQQSVQLMVSETFMDRDVVQF